MSILGPSLATVTIVLQRDQAKCARCGDELTGDRGINWSIHHRRNRGSGGSRLAWVNLPANLVPVCGSGTTGCHGWIETHRTDAYEDGFLVSKLGIHRADEVSIRHKIHGDVYLNDEGGWNPVPNLPTGNLA